VIILKFNLFISGKDQCDRDIAVAKRHMTIYVNKGNNIIIARDANIAIQHNGGLRNMKSSVISLEPDNGKMSKYTLKGVSDYHSVSFESDIGARLWKYYDIGINILPKNIIIYILIL
jgi:hypothetical protein